MSSALLLDALSRLPQGTPEILQFKLQGPPVPPPPDPPPANEVAETIYENTDTDAGDEDPLTPPGALTALANRVFWGTSAPTPLYREEFLGTTLVRFSVELALYGTGAWLLLRD